MPIQAIDLISRASTILLDEEHVRWTLPELIEWTNDAAREIIVRRPAARAVTQAAPMVAGTLQRLPADGVQLLDVVRNMGIDGMAPGRAVRRIDRQLLDDQQPDWHACKKRVLIKHFTFDERAPKDFYVYPPAVAGTQVELLFSQLPPTITAETEAIDMGPEFLNTMVSYMVYRALSKDSEFANGTVAALHYQAFLDAVTDNDQKTVANSPNANSV